MRKRLADGDGLNEITARPAKRTLQHVGGHAARGRNGAISPALFAKTSFRRFLDSGSRVTRLSRPHFDRVALALLRVAELQRRRRGFVRRSCADREIGLESIGLDSRARQSLGLPSRRVTDGTAMAARARADLVNVNRRRRKRAEEARWGTRSRDLSRRRGDRTRCANKHAEVGPRSLYCRGIYVCVMQISTGRVLHLRARAHTHMHACA